MTRTTRPDIRPGDRLKQRGFTLLDLVISIGIMGSLGGVIVSSSFTMLRAGNDTNAQAEVAIEVSKSTLWLVRDIHRAATSDLIDDGGATVSTVASFTWNEEGALETCTYDLDTVNDHLRRTCSGAGQFITNGVSGLEFTRSGELVTVSYMLTSINDSGYSEDVSLNVMIGGG